jgi:hypothetical protein
MISYDSEFDRSEFDRSEFDRSELDGRAQAARRARGPHRLACAALVASALVVAGCSTSHKAAKAPSSGPASGLGSGSAAPLSSGPAGGSLPASQAASSSDAGSISSTAAVPALVANIEAPATKAGFTIKLHRGSIVKVNPQQPKAGSPVTFVVEPATSKVLSPVPGNAGYYTGAVDGVANVKVSQGGAVIGTLAITVWG